MLFIHSLIRLQIHHQTNVMLSFEITGSFYLNESTCYFHSVLAAILYGNVSPHRHSRLVLSCQSCYYDKLAQIYERINTNKTLADKSRL